jgi:DNA-binding IclR family transcriptional regulator
LEHGSFWPVKLGFREPAFGGHVNKQKPGNSLGIQSIEVGGRLLRAFVSTTAPTSLTELAAAAGMSPSKAHRYLASFIRIGLVKQSELNGRYDLGSLVSELGFTALRRLDIFELGQDAVTELCEATGITSSLTIWTDGGPTIIRWCKNRQPIDVSFRIGEVLPVLASANGRIFAAYLPRSRTERLIAGELAANAEAPESGGLRSLAEVEAAVREIRANRLAIADGSAHPSVSAISAPVFDQNNHVAAGLTVVGVKGFIDLSLDGQPARTLRRIADALSRRLGAG